MTDDWFYKTLGQEWGPVSFDDIVELAKAEQLSPSDEVRSSRDAPWVPAESIVGLFPEPEELTDLSELDIQFVENSALPERRPAVAEPQVSAVVADAPPASGRESLAWFAYLLGYEMGPMPFSELELMVASRAVSATDFVRADDGEDWQPASAVPELQPALATVGAATPDLLESPTSRGEGGETRVDLPATEAGEISGIPAADGAASPYALQPQITTSGDQTVLQIVIQTPDGGTQTISAPIQLSMLNQGAEGAGPVVSVPAPAAASANGERSGPPPLPPASTAPVFDDEDFDDESPADDSEADEWDDEEDGPKQKEDTRWWCRIDGQEHGPVELKQLRRTVGVGRLTPDDLVRKGRKGEWVPASTYPELFRKRSSKKLAVDLEKIAGSDPDISQPSAAKIGSSGAGTAGPSRDVAALIRQSQAAALDKNRVAQKYAEDEPESLAERLKQNPMLVVVGAVLLLLAVYKFVPFGSADRGYYDIYAGLYAEMVKLRESNASGDEWSKLVDKANLLNDPIVKELEQTASAAEPAKQQLLWAGRDYLIPMLGNARSGPSDDEKLFKEHLDNALAIIEGRPPVSSGEGEAMPPDGVPPDIAPPP